MRTSSADPRPMTFVSTWTPRAAARAASAWPWPVVSFPSESRTIRFWASSGNSAEARRRAAPISVAERTGVEAIRSISRTSAGRRSTRAPLPNPTIPAASPSGMSAEALADERQGILAAGRPDRVGQVHDEDRRQAIDRQDKAESGEGEDQGGKQQRADDERDPSSGDPGSAPGGGVEGERQTQGRNEEEQRERRVEGDAHVRRSLERAAGRRRDRPRHARVTTSR